MLLIGAILIGFSIYNQPSEEEILAAKRVQDSIALVKKEQEKLTAPSVVKAPDHLIQKEDTISLSDSAKAEVAKKKLGVFAEAAIGKDSLFSVENELMKINISSKGGKIYSVHLKKYKKYDSLPLILFNPDSSEFGLTFFAQNRDINTSQLYFNPRGEQFSISGDQTKSFSMRLPAGEGKYLEYNYTLKGNSYMIDFDINMVNLEDVIAENTNYLSLTWKQLAPKQEISLENQRAASTMYYKFMDNEIDYISERNDEKVTLQARLKWVAFKQQFFTSVLIAKNNFEKPTELETYTNIDDPNNVKWLGANFTVPYYHKPGETFPMNIYLGPNHFQTLESFGMDLERQIPLGWGIFRWVNQYLVIPVFNFLNGFDINFGIIILILTIIIKLMLLPFTFKAYLSTAKMRVLKPELDELNEKYGNEDPLKKQQAVMNIYRKAGVNPMGGCLPMLLQMPVLIAMFNFFPSSIELRQESFLWATDLSTYDSILDLPWNIPFYGDHVSLFTLLMTVSTILYTRINNQLSGAASGPMAEQMKWMMYLMPIIFLGVFNNYSSGLSYYYFLANMITFGQQYLFKLFVDEKKLHAKIQEHKKKPVVKSRFQAKLEDMAKKRGVQLPKK